MLDIRSEIWRRFIMWKIWNIIRSRKDDWLKSFKRNCRFFLVILLDFYKKSFRCTTSNTHKKNELIFPVNPFSTNPIKWSNTLKQLVGFCWQIVWVFDHFVGLGLKGLKHNWELADCLLTKQNHSFRLPHGYYIYYKLTSTSQFMDSSTNQFPSHSHAGEISWKESLSSSFLPFFELQ